ncbi:Ubiquitin carboxyl-terminal hydrolase 15 [Coelomomyces lativittatus]|nr:Ubiquitin carboxyl-terminal hydrolase 15 [Coelomomyces lativittatus]
MKLDGTSQRFHPASFSTLAKPGLKGLVNLGNTCFMNSALQCISNTPVLILDYFVSEKYKHHINRSNPLGLQGDIAEAFAHFIRELWTPGPSIVTPKNLRYVLTRFAPQFRSYYQHDAQEFLGFLLDGLHEDLNLVLNKPYVESNDVDDLTLSDVEKADRLWQLHRARNDSIIVDVFQGQYKSTLKCLSCSKQSVTFDPFMILTLPIPTHEKPMVPLLDILLIVVPNHPDTSPFDPFKVQFQCASETTTPAMIAATYLPNATDFRLISYHDHQVKHVFQSDETFKDIDELDEFIYILYEVSPFILPQGPSTSFALSIDYSKPLTSTTTTTTTTTPPMTIKPSSLMYLFFDQSVVTSFLPRTPALSNSMNVGIPIMIAVPTSMTEMGLYQYVMTTMLKWTPVSISTLLESLSQHHTLLHGLESDPMHWPLDRFFQLSLAERYGHKASVFSSTSMDLFTLHMAQSSRFTLPTSVLSSFTPAFHSTKGPFWYRCLLKWSPMVYQTCFEKHALWDDLRTHPLLPPFAIASCPPDPSSSSFPSPTSTSTSTPLSLTDCFKQFSMLEQLTHPNDLVYCSTCQSHLAAEKKVDLFRLPPVLVITLKRFGSSDTYYRQKLTDLVTFPFDMVLEDVPSQSLYTYELYAVSNHYGSLGGGHCM